MFKKFIKSLGFAVRGLRFSLQEQLNIKIQIAAALFVTSLSVYYNISRSEWIAVLGAIGIVIGFEMMNTAIEDIVDFVSPGFHPAAGKIKDIAAGAVLFVSVIAAIIGIIVFYPYITR